MSTASLYMNTCSAQHQHTMNTRYKEVDSNTIKRKVRIYFLLHIYIFHVYPLLTSLDVKSFAKPQGPGLLSYWSKASVATANVNLENASASWTMVCSGGFWGSRYPLFLLTSSITNATLIENNDWDAK